MIAGRSRFHLARTLGFVVLALTVFGFAAATAEARITVKVLDWYFPENDTIGLAVQFVNTSSFTRTNKPRAVTVKYRRKTYVLSLYSRTAKAIYWRTPVSSTDFTGMEEGQRVTVVEKALGGTKTFTRTILCYNGVPPIPGIGCPI